MIARRTLLATVGGAVALAGCLTSADTVSQPSDEDTLVVNNTDSADEATASEPKAVDESTTTETAESDDRTDPESTSKRFYEALVTGHVGRVNELVHPESPTYPIEPRHIPPERFEQFETVTIANSEPVSVQDRVVQQLFADVTRTSRMRKEMGADRMQYIHTTFYVTLKDDDQVYLADTVDYLVEDDNKWYVRYDVE